MLGTTLFRQFAAVTELTKDQPALGAANLAYLGDHLWGDPDDQLAVALLIAGVDRDIGATTLERLAKEPCLGDRRAEAALHVDAPSLWRVLLEDRTLPDRGRERLLAKLLGRDPDGTLALVPTIVASAREERTRLRVARLIKDYDPGMAWELANDSTWTTERQIRSPVRLDGVLLLGTLDPSQALTLLKRFSAWSEVDSEVRVRAAITHMEQSGSPAALVNAAGAEDITRAHRAEAAKALGRPYPHPRRRRVHRARGHLQTGRAGSARLPPRGIRFRSRTRHGSTCEGRRGQAIPGRDPDGRRRRRPTDAYPNTPNRPVLDHRQDRADE